ncbi:MAG: AarF/UbiB family protein [Gammaproteobacteria bacterium]|nr:AarF/UbiB family protein [Gammaproteobacteria bacterium]
MPVSRTRTRRLRLPNMWNVIKRSRKLLKLFFGFRALDKSHDADRQQRARRLLMLEFADARGVMMKVGQLLAASAQADDELNPLIKSIKPLALKQVLPAIEAALGCSWEQVFKSIDESRAAASLGQVHHAVLVNGDEVALKVQYPQIAKAIDAEMTLLGLMPQAGPVKKWAFDLEGYRHALKDNMANELDYRHEADTQMFFYQNLALPGVIIPKVYAELCSKTLLVQSWETGDYLDTAANWIERDREKIAKALLSLLITSLFKIRCLHADPHMGNSYFRYHEELGVEMVLMDYGCTIELTEQQSLALLKLIILSRENSAELPLKYFAAMGFDADKLGKIEACLPRLCRYLFAPFIEDKKFILQQWEVGKKITALLAEERWWFRSAGPVRLIFIMRAFQGLVQQLQLLKINLNWWLLMEEVIPPTLMDQARNFECADIEPSRTARMQPVIAIANTLKVKITRNGVTRVEVDLPAEAVLDLQTFIPEKIKLKLERSADICLPEIINKVRQTGLAPQQVFDYEENDEHYQVWLE